MRIRFYAYFYPPCIGGGEVILQHQAEELARRGHEVHVHTTPFTNLNLRERGATGSTVEGGVHVHRRRSWIVPVRNPLEKDVLTPSLFAEGWLPADLLVCVGYPSIHLDVLSARSAALGTPLLVQNYVTASFLAELLDTSGGGAKALRARYWHTWTRRQLARANLVLADSESAARALRARLALTNVRVHIGMAVDPREFAALDPSVGDGVRRRLGLGSDRILLAPSRLSRQKGPDLLLDAALPLLDSGWRLVFAGPVNEEDFVESVRRRAVAAGGKVVFTQLSRQELLALMVESEIVCLPSRGETAGGVALEGMYAGALVVVSDAVEAARDDYLAGQEAGLLFPSEDLSALRAALARGMHEDHSARRRAARILVEERFTWSRSVDRLLSLYEEARA